MQLQNSSSKLNEQAQAPASPQEAIQNWLVAKIAQSLSIAPDTINVRETLTRYGLDSIDAVTMVGDLEDWLGTELPDTLLWDYPTIEKAAQYLVNECDVSALVTSGGEVEKVENNDAAQPEETASKKGWGGFWRGGR